MRCPDCSKFVAYNTEEEPNANLELSHDGMLSGDVERTLTCEECGTELKGTTFCLDHDLNDKLTVSEAKPGEVYCAQDHEWAWEEAPEPSVSPTERLEDKDKHGRQIKHTRFMTKYYGVEVTGEVKCRNCPATAVYDLTEEESASGMDELV